VVIPSALQHGHGIAAAVAPDERPETLAAALDEAEARFGVDEPRAVAALIAALLPRLEGHPALLARAYHDVAVIAHAIGDLPQAAALFELALAAEPESTDALEDFAAMLTEAGEPVQAITLWSAAARIRGDAPEPWLGWARAAAAAGEWPQALAAARRAGALGAPGPEVAALQEQALQGGASATEPAAATRPGRLLIAVEQFHPTSGGTERLAEDAAIALRDLGWEVEIVTNRLEQRTFAEHRGLAVHELDPAQAGRQLPALIRERGYDAVLSFPAPLRWPMAATLQAPHPRPRVVVVPCINEMVDRDLRADRRRLRLHGGLLAGATAIGHSSLQGLDARLCEDLGLASAYVPNAVHRRAPDTEAPARLGLAAGEPFLLVVGNQWPEKDHLGLLAHLAAHDDDVRVVLVGHPVDEHPDLAAEIARRATADPRVVAAGGATPEEVAGLMAAASLLLLPSAAEATPLVILEAMSHGLPWLATPHCGAVHDHAGGLIVALDGFLPAARRVLADGAARAALGAAGHDHWAACYTWEQIATRYDALLRGVHDLPPLRAPEHAVAATAAVRAAVRGA